ncbi:MAG: response regulator [Tolypothrix brevis GSE-NOS-MK-07-07A]|nr:response regulator [Tolypothrix brevis GSE-NOS-MK-07-07A]
MKTLPISRYRFFQKLQPLSLLTKISSKSVTGCLQVFSTTGSWSIYIEEGKLTYGCYSDRVFEMLYKNLQRLSQHIPTFPKGIYEQLRAIFETGIDNEAIPNPDYLAICWLVNQKYLSPTQAGMLIEQLAIEVLESFLRLQEGSYEFTHESFLDDMPKFCHLNLRSLVEKSQKRASYRKNTHSQVSQPQRSQFSRQPQSKQSPTQNPYKSEENPNHNSPRDVHIADKSREQNSQQSTDKKLYKIFCIDDSLTVLNAMKGFLDEQMFSVIAANEPLKALMQILRTKPDVILLDIEMPNLDGYELCSLLRKHSYFKDTPIIMVTGRTGFIDRAKAKIVRASGYLTKPFTQADLLKTIFQHIV